MDDLRAWEEYFRGGFEETRDHTLRLLEQFRVSLEDWLFAELNWPSPDWESQLQVLDEHTRYYGLDMQPHALSALRELIAARVHGTGAFAIFGPYDFDHPPAEPQVQLAAAITLDDGSRSDATMMMVPTPPPDRAARAFGIDPTQYTAAGQEAMRILGSDWQDVSPDAMNQLVAAGLAIKQATEAGKRAHAFVRLERTDGGVDTVRFRFVWPWFSPPRWELVEIKRGATPRQEADKLAAQDKIRHTEVMRVRGAMVRFQGGMFAIVGGVGGIVEGAPLLGTIEALAGGEQAALAGRDLATGKVNRAWSSSAVQAALEAAGVDAETAKFLAENGGLLLALGRASVDAAGTAHAVVETSTGYRIRLEFDPATLSSGGLGSAKIKVTRRAPDGTEIKQVGGRFPINSKYAGKLMPAEVLPPEIRAKYPKGVWFNSRGFPDFSPYAKHTKNPKRLTGNRGDDEDAANEAAGLRETPDGYTWHHHENGVTMQLVPRDLHEAVRHTGGVAVIKHGSP